MADTAPAYDTLQTSFHEAFRTKLYRVVDALPLPPNGHTLDVPCGNGFFTRRLAERLPPGGRLTAIDACESYVEQTRNRLTDIEESTQTEVRRADAYHLPFAGETFDLVWCAQSLISLDPKPAVREMFRVVKGRGVVAILEVDEFNHVLLPLPVELETALLQAVHTESVRRYGDGVKLAPARRLRRILLDAGFRSVIRATHSIDRAAPFDPSTRTFLRRHLESLRSFAHPHLSPSLQTKFDRLTDPDGEASLYRQPASELTCIFALYLARPMLPSDRGGVTDTSRRTKSRTD